MAPVAKYTVTARPIPNRRAAMMGTAQILRLILMTKSSFEQWTMAGVQGASVHRQHHLHAGIDRATFDIANKIGTVGHQFAHRLAVANFLWRPPFSGEDNLRPI